ncbi:glycosyltransferase family 2 protein [Micromonospora ureilytica]|uniref:glycosyltransferase family 2 protein n=1 Tax=Micromonospora ureilytica TaxID=709868 RepID=UPI004039A7B4
MSSSCLGVNSEDHLTTDFDGLSSRDGPVVAVVIPARNESATVAEVVSSFRAILMSAGIVALVVVVDDRSSDDTAVRARDAGADVVIPSGGTGGLAQAFRTGVITALTYDVTHILHVDADGQYSPADALGLLDIVLNGADLAIGSRLWNRPACMSRPRYFANRLFSRAVACLIGIPILDAQSGYRVFTRELADSCLISGTYTYTQEQVIRAAHLGYVVSFMPISFLPRSSGRSRLIVSVPTYAAHVLIAVWRLTNALGIGHLRLPACLIYAFVIECRDRHKLEGSTR